MKEILIITYMFYPDNNPRAFRAYELAKELSKKHKVTVLTKANIRENSNTGFEIIEIPSGFLFNKNQNSLNRNIEIKSTVLKQNKKKLKKLYNYLFYSREIEFSYEILKKLKKIDKKYDVVISIANPFACHIGTWLNYKNLKQRPKILLDYGDPFFLNPILKIAPYFKYIEKKILDIADNVILPINEARNSFSIYKKVDKKIKIIPQGMNFEEIELMDYKKNYIPTFMYAGIFYENIRNPIEILKKMNSLKEKYKFYIYTEIENLHNTVMGMEILKEIEKSNNRIILKNKVSRKECIKIMSKMDFLINIENLVTEQSPSKLIDYSLAKRPIISFNEKNFSLKKLKDFFKGNYRENFQIDIEKYDIKNVCKEFEELF